MAYSKRTQFRRLLAYAGAAICLASTGAASAYVGESYISIPGSPGHYKGKDFKDWIRFEANEWVGRAAVARRLSSGTGAELDHLWFGGPAAPTPGNGGKLALMIPKDNPDYAVLMKRCTSKASMAEIGYAESSDRARPVQELGPRPANLPAYWQFKLKDVVVADCPVVADAPEQGFVLAFKDIEWLNYDPKRGGTTKVVIPAANLPVVPPVEAADPKKVRSFLITWFGWSNDFSPDQCTADNPKPSDADYFRYTTKEEEAAIRKRNGEKGVTAGIDSEQRGPGKLNVISMPGIVPDPGFIEPKPTFKKVQGFNLDNDDGSGAAPKGIRKHPNFVSPDGRTGIDNQLYVTSGCVVGNRGKTGFRNMGSSMSRTLIQISGVDNEMNDNDVQVSFIASKDPPVKSVTGQKLVAGYTFRPSDSPSMVQFNRRIKAKIVNGVIITDPMEKFDLYLGSEPIELFSTKMRFQFQPDGSLKGVVGAYRDWRKIAMTRASGYSEGLFQYQFPGYYNALKRNADGLYNPATGQYDGISVAYEVETIPAFMTVDNPKKPVQVADNTGSPY